ncbi:MAG: hypothetical protein K0R14_532 [Burkholderiales bacterium]|jgi:hypothetical protein|nr:hypothetical protein [Burkholderiales bacterium]
MKHKFILNIITFITIIVCYPVIAIAGGNTDDTDEYKLTAKITLVEKYKTKKLQEYIDKENICKTGNNTDACNENKKNLAEDFNFNLDQIGESNPISRIDAYSVIYNSKDLYNAPDTLSGAILVPEIEKEKIKGVVLFYHPQEFTKYNVPSCFLNASDLPDYCQINKKIKGSDYVLKIGGVFASQGYVVVMPDYIGQGIDSSNMHPYMIYPQANAKSGLDMLNASRQLLKTLGIENKTELNLYLSGSSEGGLYALWASRLLQNSRAAKLLDDNNFNLAVTVPISGPYDLSQAQIPFLFSNVATYPNKNKYRALGSDELVTMKAVFATAYLTSLAYYNFNQDYSSVFDPDFLSCGSDCKFGKNSYTIPELYTLNNLGLTRDEVFKAVRGAATDTINQDNDLAYGSDNNSIKSFVADGLAKDATFNKITQQSDIINWKTTTPITFISLDYDSLITPLNTQNAYLGLKKASKKGLVHRVSISNFDYNISIGNKNPNKVKPIDNADGMVFSFIAALNEFNQASQIND